MLQSPFYISHPAGITRTSYWSINSFNGCLWQFFKGFFLSKVWGKHFYFIDDHYNYLQYLQTTRKWVLILQGSNHVTKCKKLSACWDTTPQSRYGSRHPPRSRPPWEQTPPGADTPQSRRPPSSRHPPGGDTPPRADSGIRSMSGRYASYWNAFLFAILCRKLHENEKNWNPEGGTPPWRPLGSANVQKAIDFTGPERLIWSHSSARFCFELSGNSN